jgi:hypothetical protein
MTNLQHLEWMVKDFAERLECAKVTGNTDYAHRLEHKLEAFQHLVKLERNRLAERKKVEEKMAVKLNKKEQHNETRNISL